MKMKQQLFVLAAVVSAFLWFFGAVLFQDRSFAFRDSANFYYPLFQWQTQEWRAGRVPLWNPLDDVGSPVLAETTSSVFYPGKLIFTLPVSYRLRYHIYVTVHVLVAAATAYSLARRWRASVEAAGLAGLAYGFGGSVVFQYCNVVFLVGAAWLPAALLAADRMLTQRSLIGAVWLGLVLSLMTLGGDPQGAYHAGLCAAVYALFTRRAVRTATQWHGAPHWYEHSLVLLGCAAVTAFLLAAVQILPAMELSARSDRSAFDEPRSLVEIAIRAGQTYQDSSVFDDVDWSAMTLRDPPQGTHLRHVYHFSVGPWHVAEFLWPNCFGQTFPRNERWINRLPAEGRTWTPSMYLGLLPWLLAVMTLPAWRTDRQVRFLVLLAASTLLGSFGWYGLGWIVHELRAAFTGGEVGEPWIGNPVGGLYWLAVVLLPGYVMFRYPAKLLILTTLAVSLLSARGWDRFVRDEPAKLRRAGMVVAGLSLAMAASFGALQPVWSSWLAKTSVDGVFGPVDTQAATERVLTALAHATVCGLMLAIASTRRPVSFRGCLLLAMTTAELALANAWMTTSVAADVWRGSHHPIAPDDDTPPLRLYRDSNATLLPRQWARQSKDDRLDELVRWERASLLPRHHLSGNVAVIGAHTTIRSLDTAALLRVRQQHARQTRHQHAAALLAPLSVSHLLVAKTRAPAGWERMAVSPAEGVTLWSATRTYPRAWLVSRAVVLPPLPAKSRRLATQRTREIFLDGEQPRDLRSVVFIEVEDALQPATDLPALAQGDSARIARYAPDRVEVEVRTERGAWLVLNDAFFPGWEATREASGQRQKVKIHRANRLMRAVLLPPGEHRVKFAYRPASFWRGAMVSVCAWALTAVLLVRQCTAAVVAGNGKNRVE